MNTIFKQFSIALDVKRPTGNRDFEIVEGDNGNILQVTLTDDGTPVDLTDCFVCAIFSKSTGTAQQDMDNGITLDGEEANKLTIELYNTSFAPGLVECELQVYSGEDYTTLITSAKFNFKCRRGIANNDTIESTDEWPLLVNMMQTVSGFEAAEQLREGAEVKRNGAESSRNTGEDMRQGNEITRAARDAAFSVFENYNPNKQYVKLNKVAYGGRSYVCIKSHIGQAPPHEEYWQLIADKGDKGDKPAHAWEGTSIKFENPNGSWGSPTDIQGDKGDKGDKPAHAWEGTSIKFENPNGSWGASVDLKGEASAATIGSIIAAAGGKSTLADNDALPFIDSVDTLKKIKYSELKILLNALYASKDSVVALQAVNMPLTTGGAAPGFTLSSVIDEYADGQQWTIRFHDDAEEPTLNVSGKGAAAIYEADGKAASVSKGQIARIIRYGSGFYIIGGGGSGGGSLNDVTVTISDFSTFDDIDVRYGVKNQYVRAITA